MFGRLVAHVTHFQIARNTFITSPPRWFITFTAIRPDFGFSDDRDGLVDGALAAVHLHLAVWGGVVLPGNHQIFLFPIFLFHFPFYFASFHFFLI
jgi:hypothetical protein